MVSTAMKLCQCTTAIVVTLAAIAAAFVLPYFLSSTRGTLEVSHSGSTSGGITWSIASFLFHVSKYVDGSSDSDYVHNLENDLRPLPPFSKYYHSQMFKTCYRIAYNLNCVPWFRDLRNAISSTNYPELLKNVQVANVTLHYDPLLPSKSEYEPGTQLPLLLYKPDVDQLIERYDQHYSEKAGTNQRRKKNLNYLKSSELSFLKVFNDTVDIDMRVFRPSEQLLKSKGLSKKSSLPVVLFIHGGGWALNNIDRYTKLTSAMSEIGSFVVVAVNYRKAPENPYPSGLNDCLQALFWTLKHAKDYNGDANKLVISGDSGGGNLAAAITLYLRNNASPENNALVSKYVGKKVLLDNVVKFQWLMYPALRYFPSNRKIYNSYKRYGDYGYVIDSTVTEMMWRDYVKELHKVAVVEKYLSPLTAMLPEEFVGLPETLLVVAEHDILHDESIHFEQILKEQSVNVHLEDVEGETHGFYSSAKRDLLQKHSNLINNHFESNIYISD